VQQYPEADAQLEQFLQVLGDIEDVARHIPASVGESAEWSASVNAAEENGASYCKGLHVKPLFSGLYGTEDQISISKTTGQQTNEDDDFQDVRRRKRRATDETTGT
jgi:hypothetical protein